MKFWALAYEWQEDIFYDFEKEEDSSDLKETCFLPTRDMALEVIADELGVDYTPVEITLIRLEKNGVWSYERGEVKRWDNTEF
ncbi:hypothetical protein CHH55_17130 [Niallia circulans]|uniref:hypothetical protein n=1 Tax=Niallia circulans TaxID=1397 RepID=UPI000BA66589|nr:hypothetical protein [Niallia circulans]PAD86691.1 hypothetical protein CHH55_17130 [Niallia circulans]